MNSLSEYFKKGIDFSKIYAKDYFIALIKPIIFCAIGALFVILTMQNPSFAILALLVSIPCICYGFWRGYIITYSLNYAALGYYKNFEKKEFIEYSKLVNTKELASYLLYCAIISLLAFLPSLIYALCKINLISLILNPSSIMSNAVDLMSVLTFILINSIILIPFLNFFNQALFFKNRNENFFELFLNCYKIQNLTGIIISIIFSVLGGVISGLNPIIYLILALLLNLLSFSVNTFYYEDRCRKKI